MSHDVIVVGSGAAGLTAALALAEKLKVLVLAKGELTGGSTSWAQGGIAAVLDAGDTFDNHIQQLIGIRWIEIHHCTNPTHRPDCSCAGTSHTSQPSLYTQISTDIGDTSSPAPPL